MPIVGAFASCSADALRGSAVVVLSSVIYLGQSPGDAAGSTSESVTIDLGVAAAGDKIVLVLLTANWAGANDTPSSVDIGGNSASAAVTPGASISEVAAIYYFDDTSGVVGGSTIITFTWASAEQPQMVAAYRLKNVVTGAATTQVAQNTTGTLNTLSLNAAADAIVIAGSIGRRTGDDSGTWVGVTEDNDTTGQAGDYQCSTGCARASSTETPRTVTCTWSASQTRLVGVAATWNSL